MPMKRDVVTGDRIPPRPVVRRNTPQGEAAIQLIIEPQEIKPGETITVRLVNQGEVDLLTGLPFYVQRRADKEWVGVPWPKNSVFPLVGIPLPPGGSTKPQRWPIDGVDAQPGLYRVVKSARYEDPNHARPDVLLTAHARFRVPTG
jgi:hypothetical protein